MKRIVLLAMLLVLVLSTTAFAAGVTDRVQKISDNSVKVVVESKDKIKLTGYTITKGSNIVVYYVNDSAGKNEASITVDLRTVIRPYKVILKNGEKPFEEPFADVKDSQMKDYILHLYDSGYINGYDDGTFKPDNKISRAEFIAMVVRMLSLDEKPDASVNFADLNKSHWAYSDVAKAVENGIIEGYDENGQKLIKLDQSITIAEACKIIDDAFKINNKSSANYDVRFINHWAKANIQSLLNESVVSSDDDFYKKGEIGRPVTRGEVAMLLSRVLGR